MTLKKKLALILLIVLLLASGFIYYFIGQNKDSGYNGIFVEMCNEEAIL